MTDWLEFTLSIAGYFAVMQWVLPRLGIPAIPGAPSAAPTVAGGEI